MIRAAIAAFLLSTVPVGAAATERLDGLLIGDGAGAQIVILHGDMTSGGPADYLYSFGLEVARRLTDARVHVLLRPGYGDDWGRQSPGENFGRQDQYTIANGDLIHETLQAIAEDAPGQPVIAVGHSGGAAQLALAIRDPDTPVDTAILVGCPCDLEGWRALNPQWDSDIFERSVSPLDVSPNPNVNLVLVVGVNDEVTPPALSEAYLEHARVSGSEANLILAENGDHNGNRALSSVWLQAILTAAGEAQP